jgi:hypothetical protein
MSSNTTNPSPDRCLSWRTKWTHLPAVLEITSVAKNAPSQWRLAGIFTKSCSNCVMSSNTTKPSPDRCLSWRTKWSHLPTDTCHGERSEPISRPIPVMANEVKPSPCRIGDYFSRKERSFAMTPGGHGIRMLPVQRKLFFDDSYAE